jgi:hypothetical protein
VNQALLIALASRIVERPNKQRKGPAALVLEWTPRYCSARKMWVTEKFPGRLQLWADG